MSLRSILRHELWTIGLWFVALVGVGTVVYARLENWSFFESLYATIITITTVGYGDFSPQTPAGRLFAIVFTLFSIGIGGYAITTIAAVAIENRPARLLAKQRKLRMQATDAMKDHYIVCGAGQIGARVAEVLHSSGADVVIIDDDEARLKTTLLFCLPEYFSQKIASFVDLKLVDLSHFESLDIAEISARAGIPYLLEDPSDEHALIQAGIARAQGLVSTSEDDRDNLSIVVGAKALAARFENSELRIMTTSAGGQTSRKLYFSGADQVRIPSVMSGWEMATHIQHPEVGNWWYSLNGKDKHFTADVQLAQTDLDAHPEWHSKTVGDVHAEAGPLIVAIKRDGEFMSAPPPDFVLCADDILIVFNRIESGKTS